MEDIVCDRFWKASSRKKTGLKAEELEYSHFHRWGALNKITEKSLTLANLIKVGNTDGINHERVFQTVLNELSLEFRIFELTMDTKLTNHKTMCYDVESMPRWSFYGFALTREDAVVQAAKKGLEFFMLLSQ